MERLRTTSDFWGLQRRLLADRDPRKPVLVISAGTCGQASGAGELIRIAKREMLENEMGDRIRLRITGCHGFCEMEPSVLVLPDRVFYPRVKPADLPRILYASVLGEVAEEFLFVDPSTGRRLARQDDIPYFRKQRRTILERNEWVDPIRIVNYLEAGGYGTLCRVLEGGDPVRVIEEMKASGLRGRGGAGFPTGLKWEMLAKAKNGTGKYLVCNGDEGDPGAYMDRAVLEGNPHSILEGMLIGAFATGATDGVMYVRNEYPMAVKHLMIAIRQAREMGLLGEHVLGSMLSFDVRLVKGAGAFVCGEETALMRSVMGFVGEPRQRPPFPVEKGIEGKPTSINNVETWANVPVILEKGGREYARIGTEKSRGTKIFSLVGKIRNTGLVEVPMGITIDEVVNGIGGGALGKSRLKAVQTGGPSGGCIPAHRFDLPIDYDSLAEAGSIMGSGGMIAMDERTCMVDLARYFMSFLKDESCGKCFTCRKGTQRMFEILDDISKGVATLDQLDLLQDLAFVVKDTTMCGLGQTASNPVLSTLRYFRDEYVEHIVHKRCPAGVCKDLIAYSINEKCTGCMLCLKACPSGSITGDKKVRHVIDMATCIKCDACRSVCKLDAVEVR